MGCPEDVPPGEHIVACFRPFLNHLIQLHLSRNTLRKHVNNLWGLVGAILAIPTAAILSVVLAEFAGDDDMRVQRVK